MDSFIKLLTSAFPYLVAGGVLSPIAALLNKLIFSKSHPLLKFLVVFGASVVGVLVHAFINTKTKDVSIVAAQGALITFFSTPFYLVLVKPAVAWLEGQFAKASAYDAQIKSAAEPTIVPPTPPTV